ncbi:MAG: anti-anti-sigma factor [Reinekea sp.]|jgi:anti-anti-sigma regulatory factor
MSNGRVLMANRQGQYVIKLTGDVRMTLCTTIDTCLNTMVQDSRFESVTVDVTEAEGIDSTSLGLLAKISRLSSPKMGHVPLLISSHPDITRIVDSMGFRNRVYDIVSQSEMAEVSSLEEADVVPLDEHIARERVLEAHKILMSLNESNHQAFKELVECIETQIK